MALENLTGNNVFITNLVPSNPQPTDPVSEGDNHIAGTKNVLINSFPNINAAVTATPEELNSIGSTINTVMPVGAVILWSTNTAPTGYMKVPNVATTLNRTTYAKLFAAIGTAWGAGDGSTTFGIPYIPGGYVPGSGPSVSVTDVGQNIAHTHTPPPYNGTVPYGLLTQGNASGPIDGGSAGGPRLGAMISEGGTINKAAQIAFNYCIRYQ
jgi:hypothetical protein